MKRTHFLVLSLLLASSYVHAVEPDCIADRASVVAGLERLARATLAGDTATAVSLSLPGLVELAGGKEKYAALLERSSADLKSKGIEIGTTTYGNPSPTYRAGDQFVCFVPREMSLSFKQTRGKAIGFFVAAHNGRTGSSWTFGDGYGFVRQPAVLRKLFPGLPQSIELPPTRNERQ